MVKMKLKLNDSKTCFWILALAGCLSLVIFLGMGLFNTKGEPREAIVALSMLQSGDWICPINNSGDIAYNRRSSIGVLRCARLWLAMFRNSHHDCRRLWPQY